MDNARRHRLVSVGQSAYKQGFISHDKQCRAHSHHERVPRVREEKGPSPEQESALKKYDIASGAVWNIGAFGGGQSLRLLSNLILTRLLMPEAFGIMALAQIMISSIATFSDMGIRTSIVQNAKAENREFLDTAWTLIFIRSVVLFSLMVAASFPFAAYYETPEIRYLVPIICLSTLIDGISTTKLTLFRRHVKVKQLATIEFVAQFAGLIIMVPVAWHFRTVWALTIPILVRSILLAIISYCLPGRNNRFRFHKKSALEIYHFGRWIFLSTALGFGETAADRLVFGKLVSLSMLGIYNISGVMAGLGGKIVGRITSSLIFPIMSRVYEEKGNISKEFLRIRKTPVVFSAWSSSVMVSAGASLMHTLYDAEYEASGWMLQILATGTWFGTMKGINQVALIAIGDTRTTAFLNAVKLAALAAFIPIGWYSAGFPGAIAALSAAEAIRYLFSVRAISRNGIRSYPEDLRYTAQVLAISVGGYLLAQWLTQLTVHSSIVFIIVSVVVTIVWAPQLIPVSIQFYKRHRAESAKNSNA